MWSGLKTITIVADTLVILAAGRGTRIGRVGESLHKALVPLDGRAIISHMIDRTPDNVKIVIGVGHRHQQIRDYLALAHPERVFTVQYIDGWNLPDGGPGHTLVQCRPHVTGRLTFTSCDTLWDEDDNIFSPTNYSWLATAAIPAGTAPERWCRVVTKLDDNHEVAYILDKVDTVVPSVAYTGLASIHPAALSLFWHGIDRGRTETMETQVTGGFTSLVARGDLVAKPIHWIDVGDEHAYKRAVAQVSGYDWAKLDEATYVLPRQKRVVKFWANALTAIEREARAALLMNAVPAITGRGDQMLAYDYIPGPVLYELLDIGSVDNGCDVIRNVLAWAEDELWQDVLVPQQQTTQACMAFYRDKTQQRIGMLDDDLARQCRDIMTRIDWGDLARRCQPTTFHGDFNAGNIIAGYTGFKGIDWRGDFAGNAWGDKRYDYAKFLAGMRMHWGRARRGDFSRWEYGRIFADTVREVTNHSLDIEIIGALSLINSAPLHAAPLDEILVARGLSWLEETL